MFLKLKTPVSACLPQRALPPAGWRSISPVLVSLLALFGGTAPAPAHGDLDLQISAATEAIAKEPNSADLYLRRADLNRLHGDWGAAQRDIDRARELAPDLAVIDLVRGRLFLDVKRFIGAEEALDRFLARTPDHVEGLLIRGRARMGAGKSLEAAADFAKAIECAKEPDPEYYVEEVRALVAAGSDHITDAVAVLDRGMARLGKIVTLGLYAVELDCARRDFDSALQRLDALSANQARMEAWHERRGDVLDAAGRNEEAKAAYQACLDAIKTLPPHIRNTAAVQQRQERVEGRLKAMDAAPR